MLLVQENIVIIFNATFVHNVTELFRCYMMRNMPKRPTCHMQKSKAQLSMYSLFSVPRYILPVMNLQWAIKALISLCECAYLCLYCLQIA